MRDFSRYALEILTDASIALVMGIIVEKITNDTSKYFQLSNFLKITLQIILNILVFYFMSIDSKYLYSLKIRPDNHGHVFTAIFLASQKNIVSLIESIYKEE